MNECAIIRALQIKNLSLVFIKGGMSMSQKIDKEMREGLKDKVATEPDAAVRVEPDNKPDAIDLNDEIKKLGLKFGQRFEEVDSVLNKHDQALKSHCDAIGDLNTRVASLEESLKSGLKTDAPATPVAPATTVTPKTSDAPAITAAPATPVTPVASVAPVAPAVSTDAVNYYKLLHPDPEEPYTVVEAWAVRLKNGRYIYELAGEQGEAQVVLPGGKQVKPFLGKEKLIARANTREPGLVHEPKLMLVWVGEKGALLRPLTDLEVVEIESLKR